MNKFDTIKALDDDQLEQVTGGNINPHPGQQTGGTPGMMGGPSIKDGMNGMQGTNYTGEEQGGILNQNWNTTPKSYNNFR